MQNGPGMPHLSAPKKTKNCHISWNFVISSAVVVVVFFIVVAALFSVAELVNFDA
jgi:hypothetical protein